LPGADPAPPEIGILGVVTLHWEIVEPNARIAQATKERFSMIRAGVPDDDDLKTLVRLVEDGGHGSLHEELGAVVGRYQDRNQWLGIAVPAPCRQSRQPQLFEVSHAIPVERSRQPPPVPPALDPPLERSSLLGPRRLEELLSPLKQVSHG
jgi:hypothetical protein